MLVKYTPQLHKKLAQDGCKIRINVAWQLTDNVMGRRGKG